MAIFMQKVVFFPHSDNEFKDEYKLRDWLHNELRIYRKGYYHLRKGTGLGELDKGSIVFFHKNKWIVGCAVVEEDKRDTTPAEKERYRHEDENGIIEYEFVVKFNPSSIWVWTDDEFVSTDAAGEIIGKEIQQYFPAVTDLPCLLKIFEKAMSHSLP